MTRLDDLYLAHGQSAWLDNIRRDWLVDGTLQKFVDRGVRGVTSNPSIFAKALTVTDAYDALIASLGLRDAEEAFEQLAIRDVADACAILHPVYEASVRAHQAGTQAFRDGYVSLEVSPRLAHDTAGTVEAAIRLSRALAEHPNLMIKIPATKAGLPAITQCLARGISVNVTLIFSVQRYLEVYDAFLDGIEQAHASGLDIATIGSVASFFISRLDAAIDPLLADSPTLRGRAANANAALAYDHFVRLNSESRSSLLVGLGGQIQRPLWASTSTKNPDYDQLLYVNSLVAANTVNTLPDQTLLRYLDAGDPEGSLLVDPGQRGNAIDLLDELAAAGVSLDDVTTRLENDGVAAFMSSYDELLETVRHKLLGA